MLLSTLLFGNLPSYLKHCTEFNEGNLVKNHFKRVDEIGDFFSFLRGWKERFADSEKC